VSIANSPYSLTAQQRRRATSELKSLRASAETQNPPGDADKADRADIQRAIALLARAKKATTGDVGDPESLAKVREAVAALESAVEQESAKVIELGDALTDALLDLV
jgi:hypothetical protein